MKWMAAIAALITVTAAGAIQAQTFTHVENRFSGLYNQIVAVADFNVDGRDDVVLVGWREYDEEPDTPEDRFRKAPMRMLFGTRNGRFRIAPAGRFRLGRVREPVAVAADFNGDHRPDLAVFDGGIYDWSRRRGVGNPPQLYLSRDRRLVRSSALANAVRRENRRNPHPEEYSAPADLHIKAVAAGDIDGDGDIDLWVESTGGWNITSHFMLNRGDGRRFEVDSVRAPKALLHNPPPEYWRHDASYFVDIDNDGDLDLALGQLRDDDPTHINQSSIILVNDGSGHFPTRVELPQPRFYRGYTAVQSIGAFDLDGDGFEDLFLMHTRNDDLSTDADSGVLPFTGRYVQALMNRGDLSFSDETRTRVVQGPTRGQRAAHGTPLTNTARHLFTRDLNRDGCAELVLGDTWSGITRQAPLAYRNNGRGQSRPLPPEPFWPEVPDPYFGRSTWPADVNGDGLTDFVTPADNWGPDERGNTRDDFTVVITMLNTTRPRPVRCE